MINNIKKINLNDSQMNMNTQIPILDNVNNISHYDLENFIRVGFAYVKLPDNQTEDLLLNLKTDALNFFRSPDCTKSKPELRLNPKTIEGYIDRRVESESNKILLEQVFFRPNKVIDSFKHSEEMVFGIQNCFWDKITLPLLKQVFNHVLQPIGFLDTKINTLYNEVINAIFATVALLYYPATKSPEKFSYGLNEHTDQGFITVLWINQESLQVWIDQSEDNSIQDKFIGYWQDLPPKPGYVIVNIGNALKSILGEKCNSAFHRVVVPKQERISIGLFYDPAREFRMRDFVNNQLLFGGSTAEYLKDHFSKSSSYTFESIID